MPPYVGCSQPASMVQQATDNKARCSLLYTWCQSHSAPSCFTVHPIVFHAKCYHAQNMFIASLRDLRVLRPTSGDCTTSSSPAFLALRISATSLIKHWRPQNHFFVKWNNIEKTSMAPASSEDCNPCMCSSASR